MSLGDKIKDKFNKNAERAGFPMTVLEFICWRPGFQKSSFQDYEPLHDIERMFQCNPIYARARAILDV